MFQSLMTIIRELYLYWTKVIFMLKYPVILREPHGHINHMVTLRLNDPYRGRTAPLTSKVAFYVFIQQI